MQANENYSHKKELGKKTFYVLSKDTHDAYKLLDDAKRQHIDYPILSRANIMIIGVYPKISKKCIARICKASHHVSILQGVDYFIEVSGETWDMLPESIREKVMYHEILHAAPTLKDECIKFGLRDHDLKDFRVLVSKHGVDWFTDLQQVHAGVEGEHVDDIQL
jgi:predicted metallopeptidase